MKNIGLINFLFYFLLKKNFSVIMRWCLHNMNQKRFYDKNLTSNYNIDLMDYTWIELN
jgi:hypothetical protein